MRINEAVAYCFGKFNPMSVLTTLMGFFLLFSTASASSTPVSAPKVPMVVPQDYTVTLTAYNAVPAQTSNNPLVTASGAYSNPEVVAARSRDLASKLPFGTIIEISEPPAAQYTCGYNIVSPIIGYRVIADTMNARYTNRIDILFNTKSNYVMADGKERNASTILGICKEVTIRVVGHVDLTHPSRLPKTQAELALIVSGSDNALALK